MPVRMSGVVSSGLGRAHVFMAQKHYQEQFLDLMGTPVWPGTLNLSVSGSDLTNYIALRIKSGIDTLDADDEQISSAKEVHLENISSFRIRGFLRDGISFGGATAYKASFNSNGKISCIHNSLNIIFEKKFDFTTYFIFEFFFCSVSNCQK